MIRIFGVVFHLFISVQLSAQNPGYNLGTSSSVQYDQLKTEFDSPPVESRLRCYWWWLNSMATKQSITRDLEEMKAKGYGGASIVDAGSSSYDVAKKTAAGPVFMSKDWMELYKHAIKEAERLGIELSVNIQSGWNPGGPTITPELAQKKIVYSDTSVEGGKHIEMTLRQPASRLIYKDIIVQAYKEKPGVHLIKDSVIKNWGIKSFNQSFGFKGTYPLYKLREEFDQPEKINGILKDEIIDLSAKVIDGRISWDAPPGKWIIIRYGWTATGAITSTTSDGWNGLSLDHLDPAAFEKFNTDVITPLIRTAKDAGNSLRYLQTDSWEMGNVGWTNNFPGEFKKYRGYDITPYLPVLAGRVVESVEVSNRFLQDYRKTIGDCIAANHYQLLSNLAHKNGLGMHPESGGPHSAPVDALKVLGISEFPQGEFWATANTHRIKDDERLAVKQSASVAHTYGKRYVAAEGPTSIGPQWERSPKDLKSNIDRVFCSGVNRIVWHTFTSSPAEFGKPGNEYFAGTHMNPNVTWWNQAGSFIDYLNRCSHLLSQGLFVADALYYYGDDVPNFVFLKEEVRNLAFGYDWDKCSKQVLLERTAVQNQRLVLKDGMTYRVLVLPEETAIDLQVLRKLDTLVKNGLTVIGPRPVKSNSLTNYPSNDIEIKEIATRLWGPIDGGPIKENAYGKGKVIWGRDVNSVLREMKVLPDLAFSSTKQQTALDYIHRTTDSMEIYFVVNRFGRKNINDFEFRYLTSLPDRYELTECRFRITGMVPESWDPMTGEITGIPVYREENGQTIIPVAFEPEGSRFIVFRKRNPSAGSAKNKHIVQIMTEGKRIFPANEFPDEKPVIDFVKTKTGISVSVTKSGNYQLSWSDGTTTRHQLSTNVSPQPLTGKWNIIFDTVWGGPARIVTDSLMSWTTFKDDRVKYYSGRAIYTKDFVLKKRSAGSKTVLDLGNVLELASITINGHKLPARWSPPFAFDITPYTKTGTNTLEVDVVNLWPNRLIGDSKLPSEKRLTKTNIMKFDKPDSEKMLRESGLLGPVTLTQKTFTEIIFSKQ
ncbi:glycosyl hydrolase [Flavitalea antarctica]